MNFISLMLPFMLSCAALRLDATELFLSEFVAHQNSSITDEDGDFSDWIEIVNPTADRVSLKGYYLSDDPENLRRWRFPTIELDPGEYLLVFASGKDRLASGGGSLHTNFKLDKGGEYLALIHPNGQSVLQEFRPSYPAQRADLSYSRATGSDEWGFARPSPGVENELGQSSMSTVLSVTPDSQTFANSVSFKLQSADEATVHYTLDGVLPEFGTASVDDGGFINIVESCLVRARTFDSSGFSGPVKSELFLKVEKDLLNFSSNLPVLMMETFSNGKPHQEGRTPGAFLLYEPDPNTGRASIDGSANLFARCGVRLHGTSSAMYPKFSMRFELCDEFDQGESRALLGMPSEEDWVLEGPYQTDVSLIRNALVYDLSRQMGRPAPRTRFVELFVNIDGDAFGTESYLGVYVLTESIKQDKARVNLKSSEESDDGSRTGYIFKQDSLGSDEKGFEAEEIGRLVWVFPKERRMTHGTSGEFDDPRADFLIRYLNDFQESLMGRSDPDLHRHYSEFIDVESWVDELIIQTLTKNVDAFRRSTYFHKPEGGKLHRGPVWDFDRAMEDDPIGWQVIFWQMPWWKDLTWMPGRQRLGNGDPDFMQAWVDRWQSLRQTVISSDQINKTIDRLALEVEEAQVRNFARWRSFFEPSKFNGGNRNWEGEVLHLKGWLEARAAWIDKQFVAKPIIIGDGGMMKVIKESEDNELYYTVDGSDPRLSGGMVSSLATLAKDGSVVINGKKEHNFRFRVRNGIEWSGILSAGGMGDESPVD